MNRAALDKWTIVHVAVGAGAAKVGIPFAWYTVGAIAYELIEQKVETTDEGKKFFKSSGPESAVNAVTDIGVGVLGYYFAKEFL